MKRSELNQIRAAQSILKKLDDLKRRTMRLPSATVKALLISWEASIKQLQISIEPTSKETLSLIDQTIRDATDTDRRNRDRLTASLDAS